MYHDWNFLDSYLLMFKHPPVGPIMVDYGTLVCVVALGIALMISWMCSALNRNTCFSRTDVGVELVPNASYFPLLDVCSMVEIDSTRAPSLFIFLNKVL